MPHRILPKSIDWQWFKKSLGSRLKGGITHSPSDFLSLSKYTCILLNGWEPLVSLEAVCASPSLGGTISPCSLSNSDGTSPSFRLSPAAGSWICYLLWWRTLHYLWCLTHDRSKYSCKYTHYTEHSKWKDQLLMLYKDASEELGDLPSPVKLYQRSIVSSSFNSLYISSWEDGSQGFWHSACHLSLADRFFILGPIHLNSKGCLMLCHGQHPWEDDWSVMGKFTLVLTLIWLVS